jgi:hypothetical protein
MTVAYHNIQDPEALVIAMRRVEGDNFYSDEYCGWMGRNEVEPAWKTWFVEHTVMGSQAAWQKWRGITMEQIEKAQEHDPEWATDLQKQLDGGGFAITVIYGNGGWSRYMVRGDGEVQFSARHSSPEGVTKAEAAGFRIFR